MDIHSGDPRVHCVDTMRDCDFFPENLRGRYDNMRFINCTFHHLTGSDFYRFRYCVFDNCTFYYCTFFMRTAPSGPLHEVQSNEMRYITLMHHTEFYYCSVDCISRFVDLRYLTDAIYISSTVLLLGYEYGEGAERFHHRAACPTEGSFIGYKKVRYEVFKNGAYIHSGKAIVTLEIPAHAKRSNAFGIKCRCSEAKVLKIESLPGEKDIPEGAIVYSDFDPDFRYKVGDTVKPRGFDFDDRWWNECGPGIHFFYLKEDAIEYNL